MRCFKQILCVFMVFTFNVLSLFNVIATVQHQPASKSLAQTKFQQDKPAIVEYIRNYNEYFGEQAEKYLILHDNSDRAYFGEHNDFSIYYVRTVNQPQMSYSEKIGDYTFTVPEMETWGYTLGVYMVNGETVYTLTEAYENGTITNMDEVAVMIANSGMIEVTNNATSQVYPSTSISQTYPTTIEQISTSTTPKSTIPGGAYVTYNLTNVISSNMQGEVWGYYETTLSPEPGYKINYISIKQGVEDMDVINNGDGTYTFRNNGGFINNLTITATAIPSSPKLTLNMIYTNAGSSRVVKVIDGTVKSWSTSNKNVATVNNGKVTAVGKGTATITATLTTGKKLTCKVTVTTSPRLTSTNISLKSGISKTIKAVGGTVKIWTTSNKNVATVKDGKITALSKGTAKVTATLTTGKKLSCKVTVTTAPRLSKTTVKVKKGGTATVKVSGKVATINNKYRNTKVAKITSKTNATTLKIKGLKKGTTSIKIKVNGVKTLNLKVNVK